MRSDERSAEDFTDEFDAHGLVIQDGSRLRHLGRTNTTLMLANDFGVEPDKYRVVTFRP